MKKQFIYAAAAILGLSLAVTGCKKDPEPVSETVKVMYPVITLKGSKYVSIPVGGSYNDDGATVFDTFTGKRTDIMAAGTVTSTNPGMYPLLYEATNKYGFKSTEVRWVAVTNISASENISGLYKRTTNACPMNVNKVATGIYKVDNIGGVLNNPPYVYDLYFVQMTDSTVDFPAQPGPFGTTSADGEILKKTAGDTTLSWIVIGAGFANNRRTFSRAY